MSSLQPLQKKLGLRRAKHLLRRATFRYSKLDIDQFSDLTADQAVDLLFLHYSDPIPEPQDPQDAVSPYWINTIPYSALTGEARKKNYVKAAWIHNATSNASIKHKMMLFLYNQFTISTATGKSPDHYDYLLLLDHYHQGNIRELALKVTFSNIMLRYLNNNTNTDNKPNENYAREFFELFTIGKGPQVAPGNYTHFTENDIVEAAKVFTGIRSDSSRSTIDPVTGIPMGYLQLNRHETSDKTFSGAFLDKTIHGATVVEDIEREMTDLVNMVFSQRRTAEHICERLYRYFVKDTISSDAHNQVILPMADMLRQDQYNLEGCLKQLLKSHHFYDMDDLDAGDETIGGMIKSPLQLLCEITQFFDVSIPDHQQSPVDFYRTYYHSFVFNKYFTSAGMAFLEPSTVAGYPAFYQAPNYSKFWFDSSTIIARYKLMESFISGRNQIIGNTNQIKATFDVVEYVKNSPVFSDPQDPYILTQDLIDYLFPESVSSDRFSYFADDIFLNNTMAYNWSLAWSDYLSTQDDSVVRPRLEQLVIYLVNSPEFQTY